MPGAAAAATEATKTTKTKQQQHTEPQISTQNRLHKLIFICEYNLGSLTNTDSRNN